jgi:tetratricopeptide (TPR) repeat protein
MRKAFWAAMVASIWLAAAIPAVAATPAASAGVDKSKPRLVLVKVPHWKVRFFGLPEDLPVLLEPGETFNPSARVYDFGAGLQAMEVFLALRPQDPNAPAFRVFLKKWPLYQEFFKSVDAEKFEEARVLIQKILALDPREPAVHFYAGSLSTQFGDYAQAETEYRACLARYPGYGPAYINLARLAMSRQAKEEAAAYLRQGLSQMEDTDQAGTRRLAEQMLQNLEKK